MGEVYSSVSAQTFSESEGFTERWPGDINFNVLVGGYAANTEYDVYLDIRNTDTTRILTFGGGASATGV